MQAQDVRYVEFRVRFVAFVTNSIVVLAVVVPLLTALNGTAHFHELLMPLDVATRGELFNATHSSGGRMSLLVRWIHQFVAAAIFF